MIITPSARPFLVNLDTFFSNSRFGMFWVTFGDASNLYQLLNMRDSTISSQHTYCPDTGNCISYGRIPATARTTGVPNVGCACDADRHQGRREGRNLIVTSTEFLKTEVDKTVIFEATVAMHHATSAQAQT